MNRNQMKILVKKTLCGILTAAMLAGSLSDFTANALAREAETAQIQAEGDMTEPAQAEAEGAVAETAQMLSENAVAITGTQDGDGESSVEDPGDEAPGESSPEGVEILVEGEAVVEGIDDDGKAAPGDEVSIQVTQPGCVLALKSVDEYGRIVYTAMPLDYDNRYIFTVEQAMEFVAVNPTAAGYNVRLAAARTAKLTGEAGLRLTGLASSAQGYDEVVLNFTAVQNGSDGTETTNVYYEVKVTGISKGWDPLPEGSPEEPVYYYIQKIADQNTQSKSVKVNDGVLSASTAAQYEFSVRLVQILKTVPVPAESEALEDPLEVVESGNTITKKFSTKDLYYEDNLKFNKKTTKIYTGQSDVLAGTVKYSKKASYIHDLTAVAYDSQGGVCQGITCTFKNDNDELYVSASAMMKPDNYKVVVYAGIGESISDDSPQSGTMYRANTSFTLTVMPGIYSIDTSGITRQAMINNKNITFSAKPVGYSYYQEQKAKTQSFSYEIKSALPVGDKLVVLDAVDKVKDNVSVDKNGKVTVKKGYYVDPDSDKNYLAVVITAADYAGNTTQATAFVQMVNEALVPTQIYLTNASGAKLVNVNASTKSVEITADKVNEAKVVVLDQNGNVMNAYADITPQDNAKGTSAAYVKQTAGSAEAVLYVRKPTTITLKATSKDGGKKSKSLTVKIVAPTFNVGRYTIDKVWYGAETLYDSAKIGTSQERENITVWTNTGVVGYSAPAGTVVRFQLSAKVNGEGCYHWDWFEWKYSVTGGKLVREGEYLELTQTSKNAEVTMWQSSKPKEKYSVKFINNGWNEKYDAKPNVKLKEGRLYSLRYTNAADMLTDEETGVDVIPPQRLTFTYDAGSYDKVLVAPAGEDVLHLVIDDNEDDESDKGFKPAERTIRLRTDEAYLKPGTYKYYFNFYRDGVLICKTASVNIKVTKSAPVSITANYTIKLSGDTEAVLKYKPQEFMPDFSAKLLDANVKGKSNEFSKYFEIVTIHDYTSGTDVRRVVVRPKSDLTAEELDQVRGKTMSGYVKYSYYYGTSHIKDATAKINIKVKK